MKIRTTTTTRSVTVKRVELTVSDLLGLVQCQPPKSSVTVFAIGESGDRIDDVRTVVLQFEQDVVTVTEDE